MKIKSNIAPISNVYYLQGPLTRDEDFRKQVRGKEAINKMLKHLRGSSISRAGYHIDEIKHLLTEQQRYDYEFGSYCTELGDKKELVFGFALKDGTLKQECRCYKISCRHFKKCRPGIDEAVVATQLLNIEQIIADQKQNQIILDDPYIPAHPRDEKPPVEKQGNQEPKNTDQLYILDLSDEQEIQQEVDYDTDQQENSQQQIIEGDTNRILAVSAGPGTGKTYSLIEKIKHMTSNFDISPSEEMLVLCFTRTAVKEIKDRFYRDIEIGDHSGDLAYLDINTFDTFATKLLMYEDSDLTSTSYDERIELAIQAIRENPALLENLKHFFVDEIQDLVGVRARLVKTILENAPGGFTLLGDPLQGIYDYQIKDLPDELDSKLFMQWFEDFFENKLEKVSLSSNKRQTHELAGFSSIARKLLEKRDETSIEKFFTMVNEIPSKGNFSNFVINANSDTKIGILCRTNGEVLKTSENLRKRGISHIVKRQSASPRLPHWIYELFSRGHGFISLSRLEEINNQINLWESEETIKKFNLLKLVESSPNENVNLELLHKKLSSGQRLPEELYERTDSNVCVTTIHQSKGREFDRVYVVKKSRVREQEKMDEAKVFYVAITRAKTELFTIEPDTNFLKRSDNGNGRWLQTSFRGKKRIQLMEVGLDSDLQEESFVDSTLLPDAEAIQRYIGTSIKKGDEIELRLIDNSSYCIYHNEHLIGKTSKSFFFSLKQAIKEVYGGSKFIPHTLQSLYVDQVYSIVKKPETLDLNIPEPYSTTGVWLGVNITGMGNLRWSV